MLKTPIKTASRTVALLKWAAIWVLSMTGILASTTAQADADRAALATVQGYMGSLIIGDTQNMGNRMAEKMQAERGKILGNPGYAKTLQKAYAGASYEVINSTQLSADRAEVTVRITLASNDQVHVRFELAGGPDYVIVSES